jgi:hypothetical protein
MFLVTSSSFYPVPGVNADYTELATKLHVLRQHDHVPTGHVGCWHYSRCHVLRVEAERALH